MAFTGVDDRVMATYEGATAAVNAINKKIAELVESIDVEAAGRYNHSVAATVNQLAEASAWIRVPGVRHGGGTVPNPD